MAITVEEVFHGAVFQQCDPYVAGGKAGLNNVVRWAYTEERYDVTRFLMGGEFLIIEGSALAKHSDDEGLRTYVDSLAQANISGLAIELVDFFTEIPAVMAQRGDELGLPIIGLRCRQPFVMLCQEINTRIMHEQLRSHMAIDNLSNALNVSLVEARSVQDIAGAIADIIGERVLIISPDGVVCAQAGPEVELSNQQNMYDSGLAMPDDIVLRIIRDGFTVANVVVSQRMTIMSAEAQHSVMEHLSQALKPFMPLSVRDKLKMKLLGGCKDGILASHEESMDAQSMLHALDYFPQAHCFSFAIGIRQWNGRACVMRNVLSRLREDDDAFSLLAEVEGEYIIGAFMCDDATCYDALSDYGEQRLRELLPNNDVRILLGGISVNARGMLDTMAGLRFAVRSGKRDWGTICSSNQYAFARMMSIKKTDLAIRAFVSQVAGSLLDADDAVIDTLCTLSDAMGSKTEACGMLGIKRQTLYNRLERIERITGVPQHDSASWSMLLIAARMIRQIRAK